MNQLFAVISMMVMSFHFVKAQEAPTDSVFTLAVEKNKKVLLIFSGSDWCRQCIRFEKKILSDLVFQQFADSNLILVIADFPQSKKQSPEMIKRNEVLAERYDPAGLFPHIVLLQPDQKVIASFNYDNEDSKEFITMINQSLP